MKAAPVECEVTSYKMLTPTVFETIFNTDQKIEFVGGQFSHVMGPFL